MPTQTADSGTPLDAIETWIFDLDNTLYPAASNLFAQVDRNMGEYISALLGLSFEDARNLQKQYYREYGTTLRGLMEVHAVDPHDFLDHVHRIDVSPVDPSPRLSDALAALPGRKVIYTNGSARHAENVTDRLGVTHHFEAVFDIAAADFRPKPDPGPYNTLLETGGIDPSRAAMVEDIARNLLPAAALGMTTVLVRTDPDRGGARSAWTAGETLDHVHHFTDDLVAFLESIL